MVKRLKKERIKMKLISLIKELTKRNHQELAKKVYSIVNNDPLDFSIGEIQYLLFSEYKKTSDSSLTYLCYDLEKNGLIVSLKDIERRMTYEINC